MIFRCVAQVLTCGVGVHISGTDHNWKLKFSMQTYLTHINTICKYFSENSLDLLFFEVRGLVRDIQYK